MKSDDSKTTGTYVLPDDLPNIGEVLIVANGSFESNPNNNVIRLHWNGKVIEPWFADNNRTVFKLPEKDET